MVTVSGMSTTCGTRRRSSAAVRRCTEHSATSSEPTMRHRKILRENVKLMVNMVAATPPTCGNTRLSTAHSTA